ncbi:hypothetical protein EMIHUDRAFT_198875 [Emiliania huxleyi CCMP1516]|uniref:Uncharacterized protein n=2 Tax=Emiliania huxleyi TaxID=2903 RepID=A0A0D3I1X0_EMIH1|nr:hypothetical protein EMIHUDRAFT_198875 [Emiliania huxleyi CCMP1516]EOD05255.1 hypothetical protein EMIHUDRAFT_198875 [Emiliania huxleyi CCMP1516]|eukprot:XP_005757684.1 hypothetical protein EMIHUDRAFT_198875 [Emiliania huxleyi CCMP1516]
MSESDRASFAAYDVEFVVETSLGARTFEMFVIDCREELLQWYSRQGYMPRADSPRSSALQ